MGRILKFLHSRYALAAFCIALEFVQILAVFVLLYKYFLPITVLGVIFHVCVLLYIINKDEIPEFKLPWLILLSMLPVIGAFVFMLLSSTEKSKYERLIGDGVKIYEYTPGFIHAKNIVCDDKFAVCGTINLDYRSLVHHYECGVWMYHVECIRDMKEDFEETLKQSEKINKSGAKLKGWERLLAEIMKVFSPLL
ncbi:MAG: phospholipase D-like domain-containing protein [Lachnospiraceae bacterium]